MNRAKHKNQGVTLIEIMVGFFIFTVIAGMVYHFMSGARRLSAIAATKATLRQEALTMLKYLERDIANSRTKTEKKDGKLLVSKTLKASGNGNFEMEVATGKIADNATFFDKSKDAEDKSFAKVSYKLQGTEFFRIADGKTHCLSSNVKTARFEETSDGGIDETYDGKVKLLLTLEANPAGVKDKIEHVERAIITIRQAQTKETDVQWKQRTDGSDSSTY